MRFEIDENLPVEAADIFGGRGFDAMTVGDEHLVGEKDPAIGRVCKSESRVLVTLDTDFADIRTYPPRSHAGIIVLRLGKQDKPRVLAVVAERLALEPIEGRLWIVEDGRVRVRE